MTFTVGHSIMLAAVSLGLLNLPTTIQKLIEAGE